MQKNFSLKLYPKEGCDSYDYATKLEEIPKIQNMRKQAPTSHTTLSLTS